MTSEARNSLDLVVGLLQSDYGEATETQRYTEKDSTGWWWCEGRRMLAESCLRHLGIEPVEPNKEICRKEEADESI